jgi:ABC-type ATPase with predicted acetyltransferase domain
MLKAAILFTGDHKLYGFYMNRVIAEWPISCENALTDYHINRKAWVGHAATAMALGCPEDITRSAWKELSYEQQLLANKEARGAIWKWEDSYRKSHGIQENLGSQMLFWGDS